jgi:predicted nucleic acid-binding protein
MTRFCIDTQAAIRMVREQTVLHPDHRLVAPSVLRSRILSSLYGDVSSGALNEAEARTILDGVTSLTIRLLGDRVSRRVAWDIARRLDSEDTVRAEFIAVTKLQEDALVTSDVAMIRDAEGIVPIASFRDLSVA